MDKAINEKYDTLLVDTSGRLSNNDALTAELVKMKNVIRKRLSLQKDEKNKPIPNLDVPHESLLVLDAAQGRMALDSARVWNKEVGLTGLILTKLDGSARGGSVVAVSRDLDIPVKLIGVGEGIEDLRDVRCVCVCVCLSVCLWIFSSLPVPTNLMMSDVLLHPLRSSSQRGSWIVYLGLELPEENLPKQKEP